MRRSFPHIAISQYGCDLGAGRTGIYSLLAKGSLTPRLFARTKIHVQLSADMLFNPMQYPAAWPNRCPFILFRFGFWDLRFPSKEQPVVKGNSRTYLPVVCHRGLCRRAGGNVAPCSVKMPCDVPAAFVLILHLDPTHDSMDGRSACGAHAAEGGAGRRGSDTETRMSACHPARCLSSPSLTGPSICPNRKAARACGLPFDVLLRSGGEGCRRVITPASFCRGPVPTGPWASPTSRAAGGLVLAQDPNEAGYSGMPDSAIATGLVSDVLGTSQMVGAIRTFATAAVDGAVPTDGPRDQPEASPRVPRRAMMTCCRSSDVMPNRDLNALQARDARASHRAAQWLWLAWGPMMSGATLIC